MAARPTVLSAFCLEAARGLPGDILRIAETVAHAHGFHRDIHRLISRLIMPYRPFVLPFDGTTPRLETEPQYCGASVSVLGRVDMGRDAWLGPGAVVRADGHFSQIGDEFRFGERSTVHIAHELYPAIIGRRVTAGDSVVIHGCTVGDDCVIGDRAIVLDGSVVDSGVVVEPDSTVYPRSMLKAGWVYSGSPAVAVRELEVGELGQRRQALSEAILAGILRDAAASLPAPSEARGGLFVARTACLRGEIEIGADTSVFFGCEFDGSSAGIVIGHDCNIQDNTSISTTEGPVTIGDRVTFGHNVKTSACTVGERSLIGIGCQLGAGTVVEQDVLLAAGSFTSPGQRLEQGWLWGGRPALPLRKLDDSKRTMMAMTIEGYRAYAQQYALAQENTSMIEA